MKEETQPTPHDRSVPSEREFHDLAEQFRNEQDPGLAQQLGDRLGRMIFGD